MDRSRPPEPRRSVQGRRTPPKPHELGSWVLGPREIHGARISLRRRLDVSRSRATGDAKPSSASRSRQIAPPPVCLDTPLLSDYGLDAERSSFICAVLTAAARCGSDLGATDPASTADAPRYQAAGPPLRLDHLGRPLASFDGVVPPVARPSPVSVATWGSTCAYPRINAGAGVPVLKPKGEPQPGGPHSGDCALVARRKASPHPRVDFDCLPRAELCPPAKPHRHPDPA
jgi:hypothetical protein